MAISQICKRNNCTGCALCEQVCPNKAIAMKIDSEGFRYPVIDDKKCIECGLCIKKCPNNCNVNTNKSDFYMGWHKDKDILLSSSSGGAFSALADYVLKKDGVVFGVCKDSDTREVRHIYVSSEEELEKLKLSKYYQSNMSDVFSAVKNFLCDDRLVLFTGTACQIAGLYSYLEERTIDNLITVDVLCHGVPSKKVIDAYIESQEKRFKKKVVDFSFRIKEGKMGWRRGTRMKLSFSDGTHYSFDSKYDTFFLGFNENYFL